MGLEERAYERELKDQVLMEIMSLLDELPVVELMEFKEEILKHLSTHH